MFPKLVAEKNSDFFENFEIFEKIRNFSKSWFFDFQRIFTIFEKSWFREFSKIFKNLKIFEKIRNFFGDQLWEHTTFFIINGFWIFFYRSTRNFMADSMRQSKGDDFTTEKSYFTFVTFLTVKATFYIILLQNTSNFVKLHYRTWKNSNSTSANPNQQK